MGWCFSRGGEKNLAVVENGGERSGGPNAKKEFKMGAMKGLWKKRGGPQGGGEVGGKGRLLTALMRHEDSGKGKGGASLETVESHRRTKGIKGGEGKELPGLGRQRRGILIGTGNKGVIKAGNGVFWEGKA